MKNIVRLLVLTLAAIVIFSPNVEAKLKRYKVVQEMSKIDWQLMNWTAAWRGTTKPASPFILERMEYDYAINKITIYLNGKAEQATDDSLNSSISGIITLLQERFPEFEADKELLVYYEIKSDKDPASSYIEYNEGSFNRNSSGPKTKTGESVYTY